MSNWVKVAPFEEIPKLGARVVRTKNKDNVSIDIGVFRLEDDRIFAINNSCPHKAGPLSEGIVYLPAVLYLCSSHEKNMSRLAHQSWVENRRQVVCSYFHPSPA